MIFRRNQFTLQPFVNYSALDGTLDGAFKRQHMLFKNLILGFRSLQLTIIFLPCCILYPIKGLGPKGWWNGMFKRSLMMAGPIFIKLGQWMSTRRDIYDASLIEELSTLTNDSKTHSFAFTLKQVSVLVNLNEFKYIDPVPIGSGAIAQVHKAEFKNNELVAIKVLHPGIHDQLDTDLSILKCMGDICSSFPYLKTFDVGQELETFRQMMTDQLDLRVEHKHLLEFEKNFRKIDQIQFPIPIKSNKHVLLESFMHGIHLKDFLQLEHTPFNDEIVQLGLHTIVKMILKDNFLHTDMHPGNILVGFSRSSDDDGEYLFKIYQEFESYNSKEKIKLLEKLKTSGFSSRLVILDAGLVTKLSENQYSSLLNITSAALDSDAQKMSDIFISESKFPKSVINRNLLTRRLSYMLNGVSLAESGTLLFSQLDSMKIVNSFIELVRNHQISLHGEYIGLLVSCMTVEGIGKRLSQNDFDLLPILADSF